jgi:hypothetical protein
MRKEATCDRCLDLECHIRRKCPDKEVKKKCRRKIKHESKHKFK